MEHHIVVWSPQAPGLPRPGAILDPVEIARAEAGGVVTLPVDAEAVARGGIGPYAKRELGEGLPLKPGVVRLHVPMTIRASEQHRSAHWAALVEEDRALGQASGTLMLAPDAQQFGATGIHIAGSTPMGVGRFTSRGQSVLRGRAMIRPYSDGLYGVGLYGALQGVRLVWAAVTVTL